MDLELSNLNLCRFSKKKKSQDRKKLLQQWVQTQQDPSCIEADLVISKSNSKRKRGTKELLTTAEMIKREIPMGRLWPGGRASLMKIALISQALPGFGSILQPVKLMKMKQNRNNG